MTDSEIIEKFENCTLPVTDFDHRNHVRLAWIYLQKFEHLEALMRFSENLESFAAALGKAGLYHETITFACFFVIHERIKRHTEPTTWQDFARANADLLSGHHKILTDYYRTETLDSDFARNVFVLPDRFSSGESR